MWCLVLLQTGSSKNLVLYACVILTCLQFKNVSIKKNIYIYVRVWDFITPSADNTWISLSSGNFSKREVVNWKSLDFIQRKERKSFKIVFCASGKWVFGLASQAQLKYNILIPILSVQVEHRGSNHLFPHRRGGSWWKMFGLWHCIFSFHFAWPPCF